MPFSETTGDRGAGLVQSLIRSPLSWILLLAALYRLLYFQQIHRDPTFLVPIWDEAVFDEMARSVARGQGVGYEKAYFFGPLYAYALGLLYAVGGPCLKCALIVQHVLGVLLCAITYVLGRRWFGREVGWLAAALLAVSGLQVFFEGKLLMETLVSFLLAGQLLLLAEAETRPRTWRFLAAGLLLGFAATGRPSLLLLAPLAVIPLVHTGPRSRRLFLGAIYLAGVTAVPAAAVVRNLVVEGVPTPITSSGGFNFFIGNARNAGDRFLDNRWIAADGSWNGEDTAEREMGRELSSAQVSRYWYGRALQRIGEEPVRWLGIYLGKLQLFFSGRDVPQIEWYEHARSRVLLLRFSPVLWYLMATAVAGMALLIPRYRRLGLLYGTVLVYALVLAAFFITTRYRVVMLPYLSLFAAAFLWEAITAIRRRTRRRLVLLGALGAVAALFTLPARFPENRRTNLYAQHLHDGYRFMLAEEYDSSVAAYRQAQMVMPDDYESYLDLGIVYQETGDLEQALRELNLGQARNTSDPEVPYYLGIALHKMNRNREAEAALRQSLRMNPMRALTHAYLGLVLAARGRTEEARAAFDRSLERDPSQPFTHTNLGALLAIQGDLAGARGHFMRALELDPEDPDARRNLAITYLDQGDWKRAEQELHRVLELAPEDDRARDLLRSIPSGRIPHK